MDVNLLIVVIEFLAGGFLLFLGITVARDNLGNRLNRVAGAMFIAAGLAPLSLGLAGLTVLTGTTPLTGDDLLTRLAVVWEFFFPLLLVFSWLFPVDRLRHFRYPAMRTFVYFPALIHVVVVVLFTDVSPFLAFLTAAVANEGFLSIILSPLVQLLTQLLLLFNWIAENHIPIFTAINALYAATAMYYLEAGYRFISNPLVKRQTQLVIWGIRLGLIGYFGAWALELVWDASLATVGVNVLWFIGLAGMVGFVGYALFRHQFLDVQLVFRQSLIFTITSAVLVGLYLAIGMRLTDWLVPLIGQGAQVLGWVLLVILLLLFQPINSWIDNIIQLLFMRTRSDHRSIIERFSRQIITQFDPRALRETIEETLKTSLLVEDVYFVLFDDTVSEYAVLPGDGVPRRRVLDRSDLMLRAINLLDQPTPYATLTAYGRDSSLADFFNERRVKLILPLKDSKHLLGCLALTGKAAGYTYSAEDINLLGVLANQMVTALTNARLYAESLERLRLQEEISMARQIQLDLLPRRPPDWPTLSISAFSAPSRTVGGDFYDFIPVPSRNRLGIVIADASGKGMPAALLIAQIQAILRAEVNNGNPISRILCNMNQQINESTSSEKYVTLFYGEFDPAGGQFHYANAGHNYPIVVRRDGRVEWLEQGGPIIGAFGGMQYTEAEVALTEDDLIFFFTDGLSEAMNSAGEEFGEQRLADMLITLRDRDPKSILAAVLADVKKHDSSSPPQDDTTVIALKRCADGTMSVATG